MYTGGVFVNDILTILKLQKTSKEYLNLGVVCDRNIFYYAIHRDNRFLSETCASALENLIIKKTSSNEKKEKVLNYFKEYIPKTKKIMDKEFSDIVKFVIEQFTYEINHKKNILEINNLNNEIAESFIKSVKYITIDFDLATILINKTIDNIVKSINYKENIKSLEKNKKAMINKLKYKNIMPSTLLSSIEHLNLLLTYKDKNRHFIDMVFSNIRWITKWYFEEYLKVDFESIDKKAHSNFNRIKSNESVLVYSLEELVKKGWTLEKFANEMLSLFHQTIDNLANENTSTIDEMIEIIKSQPETNRLMVDSNEKTVGCWTFDPLFPEDFEKDKKGEFYVEEFVGDTIPSLLPGIHNIHFGAICIIDEYRNATIFNKLLFSMVEYIEELALNGIFINEICTQAYTKNGRSLAMSLGLNYCCEHKDGHGKVYCGTMLELSKKEFMRDFKVLRSLYKEKFEND